MKQFVIYDDSGNILRYGMCSDKSLKIQAQEGEHLVEGVGNDLTHKVVKGKIVRKVALDAS